MNKSKQKFLFILLGILVVCSVLTLIIRGVEEKKEEIKNSDAVIMEIPKEDVTSLAWEYGDTKLSFHLDGDSWKYDEDEAFPVDEEKIDELLSIFENFGVSFEISNVESYGQYGLTAPECTITIATEDETYTLKLGDFSQMDSKRYVSIGDGNVYLVSKDPMDSYEITLGELLKTDELPSVTAASTIIFEGLANYTVTYQEDANLSLDESDVYFNDGKALDTSLVNSYLSALCNLDLDNYVTYNVTDQELEDYGLKNPELTVTVEYEDADLDTFVLHIGQEKAENGGDEKDRLSYIRIGDSKIVYQLSDTEYQKLIAASYDDLRHKDIITADFEQVTSIDVTMDKASYTFTKTKEKNEDGDLIWKDQDEKEVDITDVKSELLALSATSFTSKMPEDASEKVEEIQFTLHLDNEVASSIQVNLYRYNGSECVAEVDGKVTCLLDRSTVVSLMEAIRAIEL